jgi:hypothetical protein
MKNRRRARDRPRPRLSTFPSFSRRGGCAIKKKVPFLSGADGVVSNFNK